MKSRKLPIMKNYLFERAARRRRTKAMIFTFLFHALLIAGIAYSGNVKVEKVLPISVMEWLGMDNQENPPAVEATDPQHPKP